MALDLQASQSGITSMECTLLISTAFQPTLFSRSHHRLLSPLDTPSRPPMLARCACLVFPRDKETAPSCHTLGRILIDLTYSNPQRALFNGHSVHGSLLAQGHPAPSPPNCARHCFSSDEDAVTRPLVRHSRGRLCSCYSRLRRVIWSGQADSPRRNLLTLTRLRLVSPGIIPRCDQLSNPGGIEERDLSHFITVASWGRKYWVRVPWQDRPVGSNMARERFVQTTPGSIQQTPSTSPASHIRNLASKHREPQKWLCGRVRSATTYYPT